MPIQLNYTDSNTGFNFGASYWFIQAFSYDQITGLVTYTINGYFTLAAKAAGKNPFYSKSFSANPAQLGLVAASTVIQIINAGYAYALTWSDQQPGASAVAFFAGGTIV